MKILKDILTGVDNETYDHGRVMCFVSFILYFGLAFSSFWSDHAWDAMSFAGGIGAMAVSFGVHLKLKSDTEPKKNDDTTKN